MAANRPPMDYNKDVLLPPDTPDVKQEAFRVAIEEISLKLMTESVGAEVMEKQSVKIKQILSKSEKYILFIKGSSPEQVGGQILVKVEMKIALDNLDALLRESGLVLSSGQMVSVLPLTEWLDECGDKPISGAWWNAEVTPDVNQAWQRFSKILSLKGRSRNIKFVDSAQIDKMAPAYRKLDLSRDEQIGAAGNFDSTLIIAGKIQLGRGAASAPVRLTFVQAKSGKELSEMNLSLGPAKDCEVLQAKIADAILDQIKTIQTSGRLNLNGIRLIVNGRLSYSELERFRKELLDQVHEIKFLKDRMYGPDQVIFEAETSKSASDLISVIRKVRFSSLRLDFQESPGAIVLNIKSL